MKPYTAPSNVGRKVGGDDIHHKTADLPRIAAKKAAKVARHGARQAARRSIASSVEAIKLADDKTL